MKVKICTIRSYDLLDYHDIEIDDGFEVNEGNVVRFLKDVRRKYHLSGKAYIIAFPDKYYYVYRMGKNDFKVYNTGVHYERA